jgi:membrane protein required for colicin V production
VNDFDLAVLAVVAAASLMGLVRGAVREGLGLAHILACAALAVLFSGEVRLLLEKLGLLSPGAGSGLLVPWFAGFALVFLLGTGLLTVLRVLLRALRFPGDRVPGFVLGALRGAALVWFLLPLVFWIAPHGGGFHRALSASFTVELAQRAAGSSPARWFVPPAYADLAASHRGETTP